MKKLPFILLLFQCYLLSSQNRVLVLFDSIQKKPIKNVHVKYKGNVFISDSIGNVTVPNLKTGKFYFSHIKYLDRTIVLSQKLNDTIFLIEQNNKLSEVLISYKKKRKLTFETLPELEKGIHSFASVLYEGKIYVFGGDKSILKDAATIALKEASESNTPMKSLLLYKSFISYSSTIYVYTIKTKRWSKLKSKTQPKANHKAVLIQNKVYLIGGKKISRNKEREYLTDNIEVFNLITKRKEKSLKNKHKAVNQGVSRFGDKIILLGGSVKRLKSGKQKFSNDVTLYDTKQNKWRILGKLPDPKETESVRIKEKVYLIGGNNNKKIDKITSFNLRTGKWRVEKRLPNKMSKPAIEVNGNLIYIFSESNVYVFNTLNSSLKEFKINLLYESCEMFLSEGYLYLLGGYEVDPLQRVPSKKMFRINLKEFETTRFKTF
ncbi:Kelch repeat-containing protein [Tenacibaculum halocynthiae]|uniref:Kelch repeat-containing protein n=1 Tax=Tenacibaculum halocynthiae TaxID=1254437 RepID=UPI003D65F6BD